jgi:hypothetical protein
MLQVNIKNTLVKFTSYELKINLFANDNLKRSVFTLGY